MIVHVPMSTAGDAVNLPELHGLFNGRAAANIRKNKRRCGKGGWCGDLPAASEASSWAGMDSRR